MSSSNGLRIIVWIYLLIIKGAIVCGQVAGPNAVVLINGQATLDCVAVNMAITQWSRTTDGSSNSLPIASGCSVSGSNAAYYSTEKPGGNICRLIIGNATMQQAGVYPCYNGASTTFNSLVTVIDPAANVVVYNQPEIVEGDQLNISCSINYTGPSSPAPSLRPEPYFTTLPGHNFTSLTYYSSANVVTVVATVRVQKPKVPIFRCNTVFDITGNTAGYNATPPADNIAVGATTEIGVQYEPSTPIISHEINNFTASDRSVCTLTTLTCNSTANPPPNYTWKDVTSGKVIGIYGSIFEWAEDNRTYECTATNTIKSANKSSSASYTVGNSSALPCASVKSTDIRICSDDGSCDDGATPRSCSNASHIYLTCNVSNVYPSPTQFQWKDGSGNILINTSEYNATINGGYSVFVYNEINQQSKTPAVIYVTVTDCCAKWKLIVSVIIPWIGVCLIATIIFIVCYASLRTPFRAKMLSRFSWLEYMLPCVNSPKVEPQRGDESAESSAPIWKILGFVILLIFVSVTCGILFFPILITIAYCCPTVGEDNDGQMMNRSSKKGKPISKASTTQSMSKTTETIVIAVVVSAFVLLNLIAMSVFLNYYNGTDPHGKHEHKQVLNNYFPWLKQMLPCFNKYSDGGGGRYLWVFLFILVSLAVGFIVFPILLRRANCTCCAKDANTESNSIDAHIEFSEINGREAVTSDDGTTREQSLPSDARGELPVPYEECRITTSPPSKPHRNKNIETKQKNKSTIPKYAKVDKTKERNPNKENDPYSMVRNPDDINVTHSTAVPLPPHQIPARNPNVPLYGHVNLASPSNLPKPVQLITDSDTNYADLRNA